MTDDDFADLITETVHPDVNILIICDCCHSGTIGDFEDPCWDNFKAVSTSGCKDSQTSGDTGQGGIFTHALLLAIQDFADNGDSDYSVGQLYNIQLDKDDETFDSKQDITLNWTSKLAGAQGMAWPMIPDEGYVAPYNR